MAAIEPLFFFLFTLFQISIATSSNEFDIYQVNLQWNPATCSDRDIAQPCYKVPSDKFSISGLWPIRVWPFQVVGPCQGTSFNLNAISGIQFSLRQKWPDIISGKDEELWKKEWESHGTCSEDYLHQAEYFEFAVNAATSHNLLRILEDNGVTPTDAVYPRDEVVGALERAIGVRPAVRCNLNGMTNASQLHEMGLCYRKETETLISCPENASTCGHRISWYPYMRRLYGYFQVVFQWQPASCFNHFAQPFTCFQSPDLRFSLDGVWPTRRSHFHIGSCSDTPFDINQISSIRARLDWAWPDLSQRRNDVLWGREWSRRGTCSEDQFGQLEYFSFALHAFETNDFVSMLRRYNITPNGQLYRREDVENAIIRSIGVIPYLLCNLWHLDSVTSRFDWQFHQIILCYDDNARRRQDCYTPSPNPTIVICPPSFYWNV